MLVDVNTGYLIYLECQHNRKGHETVLIPKNIIEDIVWHLPHIADLRRRACR